MVPIVRFHPQPSEDGDSAGEFLRGLLRDPEIETIDIVVAWVRFRGLARLRDELDSFRRRGTSRIILGIDEGGATCPGLIGALRSFSEAYVYHVRGGGTFHPKVYLGEGPAKGHLFVGSSNLTPGGLFFNDEASLEAEFVLPDDAEETALVNTKAYVERLLADVEVCLRLTEELVDQLVSDPRYRVSGHERRTRRTDAPLPEGVDEADVDEGGEQVTEDDEGDLIFGVSHRLRATVPGLSDDALAELAALEHGEEEPAAAVPPTPPPGPFPPVPRAAPAVAEQWTKLMSRADAQQPDRPDTNPTGVLRLSQAGHDIDWRTWFRRVLFGSLPWTATQDTRGNPTETVSIPMDATVAGLPHGTVNVRVDHAPHRVAGQSNVPTIMHWGPTLGAILRATDYHGRRVSISYMSDGTHRLEIS